MNEEVVDISPDQLLAACARMKIDGCRFVTMSCVAMDESTHMLLYHFDKDLKLAHFRLTVGREESLPSITPVYFAAFLVENEIQDQFGLGFHGLVVNYERTLYLDQEAGTAPLGRIG